MTEETNVPFRASMFLPGGMQADDAVLLGAGAAAFVASIAVGLMLTERTENNRKRIKLLQERREELQGEMRQQGRRKKSKAAVNVNLMRQVVNRFHLLKSAQAAQIRTLLNEAGLRSKDAIVIYMFAQLVLPVIGLIVGLVLMNMDIWGAGKLHKFRIVSPVALCYLGLKLPMIYVKRVRKKRFLAVQRALSDTLDLMTICAEAGLTLSVALERVSRELALAYPVMAEELALTAMELGFLPERNKALLNLAERVNIPEIRGIVSVLIQTEKYGTPIAQAMRVLSHEFREQRMLRAENKAARLPALMTVPMIVFILPTLFIVIMAPAIIKIISQTK